MNCAQVELAAQENGGNVVPRVRKEDGLLARQSLVFGGGDGFLVRHGRAVSLSGGHHHPFHGPGAALRRPELLQTGQRHRCRSGQRHLSLFQGSNYVRWHQLEVWLDTFNLNDHYHLALFHSCFLNGNLVSYIVHLKPKQKKVHIPLFIRVFFCIKKRSPVTDKHTNW